MENNVNANRSLEKNLYRTHKKDIHSLIDTILSKEKSKKLFLTFFGLRMTKFSEEDQIDFLKFVRYSLARVVNNSFHKFLYEEEKEHDNIIKYLGDLKKQENVLLHDVSHGIVSYYLSDKKTLKSTFFSTDVLDEVNNPILIEEEIQAMLWYNPFQNKPIPVILFDPTLKNNLMEIFRKRYNLDAGVDKEDLLRRFRTFQPGQSSFEDYKYLYKQIICFIVSDGNYRLIKDIYSDKKDVQEKIKEYKNVVDKIINGKDDFTDSILRKVFDEHNNYFLNKEETDRFYSQVLFNEFKSICGPLIKKINTIKNV